MKKLTRKEKTIIRAVHTMKKLGFLNADGEAFAQQLTIMFGEVKE